MEKYKWIEEGHYEDHSGNKYMSIWTYKRMNNIKPNSNDQNYADAKAISCSDKFWAPFNESDVFKKGYMYSVACLNNYYL